VDGIANIAFVNESSNKSLGATNPAEYLTTRRQEVLVSQCIPIDDRLWTIGKSEELWHQRRVLFAEAFNEFLREAFPHRRL